MPSDNLNQKVVLVLPGGAKNLGGRSVAICARKGANLVVHFTTAHRPNKKAEQTVAGPLENFGREAIAVQGDLTKPENVRPASSRRQKGALCVAIFDIAITP